MGIGSIFSGAVITEGLNRILPFLKGRLYSLISATGITDAIKQEIDKIINEVKKSIETEIDNRIKEMDRIINGVKESIEAEIDNKITKLRKQIIRYIIFAWVIQTGVIIALLWLFSR